MPAERVVQCPYCKAPKTTKAAQNNRLSCGSCGQKFLCPAPPALDDPHAKRAEKAGTTAAPARPKTAGKPRGSGATVVTASEVKVRKNAKVRQPKTDDVDVTPEVEVRKVTNPDAYKKPDHQERSKLAGRRGGVGFYNRKIKHSG